MFTLLLKASTSLLGVPAWVWQVTSGVIVALLGLTMLFPKAWDAVSTRIGLQASGGGLLDRTYRRGRGFGGDALLGAALGPAFSSCSPTYALDRGGGAARRASPRGTLYIVAYAIGLASRCSGSRSPAPRSCADSAGSPTRTGGSAA